MCERECIQFEGDKCKILESACPVCLTRAKHCPDGAVKIINLPEELDTDLTHSYGQNAFRLFRLPSPRQEQIVGILGPNGIGKSTAINILSGSFRPNLGNGKTYHRVGKRDFYIPPRRIERLLGPSCPRRY